MLSTLSLACKSQSKDAYNWVFCRSYETINLTLACVRILLENGPERNVTFVLCH